MSQTPEDRMYLFYKAAKKRSQYWHYRKGWIPSPVMQIAQRFEVPCQRVRDVLEARRVLRLPS